MKYLLFIMFFFICSQTIFSANYSVLSSDTGVSAKTVGIANIYGFDHSASSVFENIASLYSISSASFSAFETDFLLGESKFFSYSAALRIGPGVLAGAIVQNRVNDITKTGTDQNNEYTPIGTFNYQNSTYKIGYQIDLSKNLHLGLASSYYQNIIDTTTGSGFNFDFGALVEFEKLSVSFSAQNFVKNLVVSYTNGTTEQLPTQIITSAKYSLTTDLDIFGQFKINEIGEKYLKAIAMRYQPDFLSKTFYLSAGWQEYQGIKSINNKFGIGLGLELKPLNLNFAYEKSDYFEQDGQYYVSTSINL